MASRIEQGALRTAPIWVGLPRRAKPIQRSPPGPLGRARYSIETDEDLNVWARGWWLLHAIALAETRAPIDPLTRDAGLCPQTR